MSRQALAGLLVGVGACVGSERSPTPPSLEPPPVVVEADVGGGSSALEHEPSQFCGAHERLYFDCVLVDSEVWIVLCGSINPRGPGAYLHYHQGVRGVASPNAVARPEGAGGSPDAFSYTRLEHVNGHGHEVYVEAIPEMGVGYGFGEFEVETGEHGIFVETWTSDGLLIGSQGCEDGAVSRLGDLADVLEHVEEREGSP